MLDKSIKTAQIFMLVSNSFEIHLRKCVVANVLEKLSLKIPEVHQSFLNYCFKNFVKRCKNRYRSIIFRFIF